MNKVSDHNRKEAKHHKAKSWRLKWEREEAISNLKLKHKNALCLKSQLSAAKIKEKNNQLNEVFKKVVHLRASWAKTLDDIKALRSERRGEE